jgi:DNA/RNA-binding domain of Phe-tRNA-synthetase-like protein
MKIPSIKIEEIVRESCPDVRLGLLLTEVKVTPSDENLLSFIEQNLTEIQSRLTTPDIHDIPPLASTRQAYKALGKDPSRYRPSAEALLRRVVKGKGLYRVNNVVDALNLISVQSGFSIGGYNLEKIKGQIRLGRGEDGEPYEAIGRGELNIAGLPVLRDDMGAFGSPTSDSTRTMATPEMRYFLTVFFDFEKNGELENAMEKFAGWLVEYAGGGVLSKK